MAKEKQRRVRSPRDLEAQFRDASSGQLGFADVLKFLALGIAPAAPRLPEQAYQASSVGGGYAKGFSGQTGTRGSISFSLLRQIAERSMLLAGIITRRQFQVTRFARIARASKHGEVGFRVVHRRQGEPDFTVPDGFKDLCRELEYMLLTPWKVYWAEGVVSQDIEPNLSDFMSKVMEDHLVINRPCIELGLDPMGIPRAFGAIDGANVVPTFAALKYLVKKGNLNVTQNWEHETATLRTVMQQLSDTYQIDINEAAEYVYVLNGRPVASFPYGRLIIAPFLPGTDVKNAGYPRSLTEKAAFAVLAEIMAMSANLKYFQSGNMSEVLLTMKGSYDDKHVQELTQILQANMSGVEGMFRVPLVALPSADDLNVLNIKQNHKDMLFDFYIQKLTNIACAIFAMHPSEINEAPRAGDNSGGLQQASQEKQISMAQEDGLESSLNHFATHIFNPILQRIVPDACLEWDLGHNEQEVIQLATSKATFITVNEQRKMCGLEPISDKEGGSVIANPFIQTMKQMAQQQQMTQQQPGAMGQDETSQDQPQNQGEMQRGAGQKEEFSRPPF